MSEQTSILNDVAFWVNAFISVAAAGVTLYVRTLAQQLREITNRFKEQDEELVKRISTLREDIIDLYGKDVLQSKDIADLRVEHTRTSERLENLLIEHRRIHK